MQSPAAAKPPSILALRCLGPDCNGLLAYEVSRDNVLHIDLGWTARHDGEVRYFPCPKCGGKNVIENIQTAKGPAVQVTRWLP